MEKGQTNLVQGWLRRINAGFRRSKEGREWVIDPENHRIDKQYGIVKNFMRLTNKALLGMRRVRINRSSIFVCSFGLLLGYGCSELDDSMALILGSYRPVIKQLLIKQVLKNEEIKRKLNQALLENVYTNEDIQFNLHEVLINKAIRPQEKDLFELSKKGIILALEGEEIRKAGIDAAVRALADNGDAIASLALQFLGGPVMLRILTSEVSELLESESVSEQISSKLKLLLRTQLNGSNTRESIYSMIREKFIG